MHMERFQRARQREQPRESRQTFQRLFSGHEQCQLAVYEIGLQFAGAGRLLANLTLGLLADWDGARLLAELDCLDGRMNTAVVEACFGLADTVNRRVNWIALVDGSGRATVDG